MLYVNPVDDVLRISKSLSLIRLFMILTTNLSYSCLHFYNWTYFLFTDHEILKFYLLLTKFNLQWQSLGFRLSPCCSVIEAHKINRCNMFYTKWYLFIILFLLFQLRFYQRALIIKYPTFKIYTLFYPLHCFD